MIILLDHYLYLFVCLPAPNNLIIIIFEYSEQKSMKTILCSQKLLKNLNFKCKIFRSFQFPLKKHPCFAMALWHSGIGKNLEKAPATTQRVGTLCSLLFFLHHNHVLVYFMYFYVLAMYSYTFMLMGFKHITNILFSIH